MRISVTTSSFTAAFAAVQTLSRYDLAVSAVDLAYEAESGHQGISAGESFEECTFTMTSFALENEVDAGILKACSDPDFVCAQDSDSSLGGRCVLGKVAQRDLQSTCTKCSGYNACKGLDPTFIANNIGANSCCGAYSCYGIDSQSSIGQYSCQGYKACYNMDKVSVKSASCIGEYSCRDASQSTIAGDSCTGYKNCYWLYKATIGDGSCTGYKIKGPEGSYGFVCAYLQGKVGDGSCWEYAACYQAGGDYGTFDIGNYSCLGQSSCEYGSGGKVGNGSCNEFKACYYLQENVGNNSCVGIWSCGYLGGDVGDCACQGDKSCYESTGPTPPGPCPGQGAPTRKPSTSPPTSQPTPKPTARPTMQPTKRPITMKPTNPPAAGGAKSSKTTKSSKATKRS